MLTRRVMAETGPHWVRAWWAAAALALVVLGGLVTLLTRWTGFNRTAPVFTDETASIARLGQALVSPDAYVLPFEIASVLLLAALVGSIYIAGQRK